MAKRRERQLELFKTWKQKGWNKPGPKAKGPRPLVPHRTRAAFPSRNPSHVTIRLREGLPSMRVPLVRAVLVRAFKKGSDRFGFRLVHYSIQGNHLHLITEAKDRTALSRGMQGLLIRCAKALNKLWKRKGSVFADRYHNVVLDSPTKVRNALVYVLQNARRHGERLRNRLDAYSSGPWFDGWKRNATVERRALDDAPTARARTWLLGVGWRRRGLLCASEVPSGSG